MVRETNITEIDKSILKMEYEPEADVLTIYLRDTETPLSSSSEAEAGVILNYAEDGREMDDHPRASPAVY